MEDTVVFMVLASVMPSSMPSSAGYSRFEFFWFLFCWSFTANKSRIKQKLIEIIINRKKRVKPNVSVKYTEAEIK